VQRVLTAAQLNLARQTGFNSREQSAAARKELARLNVNPDKFLPAGFRPLLWQVR
jgi:hypothetical protein